MIVFSFFPITMFLNKFFLVLGFLCSFVISFSVISLIIVGSSCFRYFDLKKIIAFTPILHLNLTLVPIYSLSSIGLLCGILTSISHGFSSVSSFLFGGVLINKTYSRYFDSLFYIDSIFRGLFLFFLQMFILVVLIGMLVVMAIVQVHGFCWLMELFSLLFIFLYFFDYLFLVVFYVNILCSYSITMYWKGIPFGKIIGMFMIDIIILISIITLTRFVNMNFSSFNFFWSTLLIGVGMFCLSYIEITLSIISFIWFCILRLIIIFLFI